MNENELQLQRLVDGQLDRGQVQQLLAKAQRQPELWQQIALAFVEDQIWQAEIGDRFLETADPTSASILANSPAAKSNQTSQSSMGRVKLLLSLAAATLIGLWLGNYLGDYQKATPGPEDISVLVDDEDLDPTPDPLDSNHEQRLANNEPVDFDPFDKNRVAAFKPVQHLSIDDVGQIPLYTLADANKMGITSTEPEFPKELVEEYQRQGYKLHGNTQFISGRNSLGQLVIVPVRSISLNPVN